MSVDSTIGNLPAAQYMAENDLLVAEQGGTAKKMTGRVLIAWLTKYADGHGGIYSIEKTATDGLVDTYTITLADGTTTDFTVTNGAKGEKGETGDTGAPAEVVSSTPSYQVSQSGVEEPTGEWSATVPEVPQGQFLWTKSTTLYNSGAVTETFSIAYMGRDGMGTVNSVAGVPADGTGNVTLTAADVGARPDTWTGTVYVSVSLGTNWVKEAAPSGPRVEYTQAVTVAGSTAQSKVDLLPSMAQLDTLRRSGVTKMQAENTDGAILVRMTGGKTTEAMTMAASITEVTV